MLGSKSSLAPSGMGKRFRSRVFPTQTTRRHSKSARVRHLVMVEARMGEKPYVLPGHAILPEPLLLFGGSQTDTHPLRGLSNYGPYSAGLGFPSRVRLAYLAPAEFMDKLDGIVKELNGSANPKEAVNYYLPYAGFRV